MKSLDLLLLLNDSRLPFKVGLLVCMSVQDSTSLTPVARASLSPCQHHRETILSQLGFKNPIKWELLLPGMGSQPGECRWPLCLDPCRHCVRSSPCTDCSCSCHCSSSQALPRLDNQCVGGRITAQIYFLSFLLSWEKLLFKKERERVRPK